MSNVLDFRDLYPKETNFHELYSINKALNQSAIVAITDPYGTITFVNDYFCKISKYSEKELLGENHRILNSGVHSKTFFTTMWKTISNGNVWTGEICNRAKDGSLYWVSTTIVPFFNEYDEIEKYISIRVDITGQKNYEKINYLIHFDELTKLPNRQKLILTLEELIKHSAPFNILFLDINRFKVLNEQFGHEIGDAFLKYISKTIRKFFPNQLYRLHSDEFILLIRGHNDAEQLHTICSTIFSIFEVKQSIQHTEFYSSVSIGISQFPNDADTAVDMIKYADVSMQEAKKLKGNYYSIFEKNELYSFLKPLHFEAKLREALQNEAFTIEYQPKFNTSLQKFDGMEALIRWTDSELGFVSPNEFIPFAEQYGFISMIDQFVIKQVVKTLQHLYEQFAVKMKVAVNISAIHLAKHNFVETLTKLVDAPNVSCNQIELEITETAMLHLNDTLLQKLHHLRNIGFQISVDDFGTGFSCLSYLQKLPINTLKIDRSFILKIEQEASSKNLVKSLISLGHAMNLRVVAEGVESPAQSVFLSQNECEFIQGYYYSKPVCLEKIHELIQLNKFHL